MNIVARVGIHLYILIRVYASDIAADNAENELPAQNKAYSFFSQNH